MPNNKKSKGKNKKPTTVPSEPSESLGSKRGASEDNRTALHDETGPAIQHEDDFGDEFEQEDMIYNEDDDEDNDGLRMEDDEDEIPVRVFRPGVDTLAEGEELTFDPSAYVMHHALRPEWPSLSFDFVRDDLGGNRSRFPLTMFAVAGSQAATVDANKLTLMKFSELHRMKNDRNSDDLADSEAVLNLDDDDQEEKDPLLDSIDIPHPAGINRVRSCPQKPGIVATFGDDAKVRIFDLSTHLASLVGHAPRPAWVGPSFTFEGHKDEGYALDWSPAVAGQLATGDCAGNIHVWLPREGAELSWNVEANGRAEHTGSVEDIQWSPSEATVFISCSVDQSIKVWDVREPRRSMVTAANTHPCDINVLSWNPSVAYLLASGADDGCFKIWDLRTFGAQTPEPVANFRWHSKPITSIEWHPSDESVVAVASDDDSISFWDMSVEEDAEADPSKEQDLNVPPQLLFVHQGQHSIKELHFHPQVPGVVMSTALDGYNIFKPNTNI